MTPSFNQGALNSPGAQAPLACMELSEYKVV